MCCRRTEKDTTEWTYDIYLKSALSSFNQETDIACTATLYVMKTGVNDRNSYSRLILFMLS